ncbi:hypothetical protein BUZ15_08780 [Staphylococcus gallinarum]|nr:hypothetical protein [Staphylococcus gallinarum]MCD8820510.1 hypothetical protein [Staphylococcus gallinarum]PTL09538.1 hypothetical protein BUZ09_04980 [Staphylococcus gallinarum]PTL09875.1 hypothetical protein BUZ15_08780 [Staphylococcus gallinarum]
MKFDLNSSNGILSEDKIYTHFIIGTGIGQSIVNFSEKGKISFVNATPIIYAHYIQQLLLNMNIQVDINNYMDCTIISFEFHMKQEFLDNYKTVYNTIVRYLKNLEINEQILNKAISSAKEDMKFNFINTEFRATLKFMEQYDEYFDFDLKKIINDIWDFKSENLIVFVKEMIFQENIMVNISHDILNKDELERFQKRKEKFYYPTSNRKNKQKVINEVARNSDNYLGYLLYSSSFSGKEYEYSILLILGMHLYKGRFQIHSTKKQIGIVGKKIDFEKMISGIQVTEEQFNRYVYLLRKSIEKLYLDDKRNFYEILAKLNGSNLMLDNILFNLNELELDNLNTLLENTIIENFEIHFKDV